MGYFLSVNFLNNLSSKGFFHLLTANYFIGFLGLASQLLVVKFLSPSEMGDIKTLQSLIAVISILAGFGFNTAVLKICSEDISIEIKKAVLIKNLKYTLFSISIILLFVIFFVQLNLFRLDENINDWLMVYLLTVPASVLVGLFMTYLQALKKVKLVATVQSIVRLFGLALIVLSTYLYEFSGFVWSTIIVSYLSLFAILVFIKKDIKSNLEYKSEKRNFEYATWSVAANLVGASANYLDIFILNGLNVDKHILGFYSIATIFLLGLSYVTSTIQSIATPYFSEKSNDKIEFMRVLNKYLKLIVLISIGIGTISFFIVPLFINFVYGDEYILVGNFFQILVFKYIFWSCFALMGVAVLGIGGMKYNFLYVLVTTFIAFIVTFSLGIKYGAIGIAYGQVISYFIAMIIIMIVGKIVIVKHFEKLEATNG